MKKFSVWTVLFALCIFTFISCNDDDNGSSNETMNVKVTVDKNATFGVDSVYLTVTKRVVNNWISELVSGAPVNNGSFNLFFPALNEQYLIPVTEDYGNKFLITDMSAKIAYVAIWAYKDGESVGYFNYENTDMYCKVDYVYVDRDVNIMHNEEDEEAKYIFKLNFKKGWNKEYYSEFVKDGVRIFERTTTPVSGLSWKYYGYAGPCE